MPTTMTEWRVATIAVPPLTSMLERAAHDCAALLPASTGCALNLLTTDGRRITSVTTTRTGGELNALCDQMPDNPCTRAWQTTDVVLADTLAGPQRWSGWLARAHGLGVRTVLAATLRTHERRIGSVAVYSPMPNAFALSEVKVFADFASDAAHHIDACQRVSSSARLRSPARHCAVL